MSSLRALTSGVAVLALAVTLHAQQTVVSREVSGPADFKVASMTGEVAWVSGNLLICKMQPEGTYRLFDVVPGRKFFIDGQPKLIGDLKIGTVLTAVVVTTTQPVTVRTTTVQDGRVIWVAGDYVILQIPGGEYRDYKVAPTVKFLVEGKDLTVLDLKVGMRVSASKIVEEPRAEISSQTVITGKGPK